MRPDIQGEARHNSRLQRAARRAAAEPERYYDLEDTKVIVLHTRIAETT